MSKILGLPIGAWITAALGIGTSYYFYKKHVDTPRVTETHITEPSNQEALAAQALSGSALGGGSNTRGSVQLGSGEVGITPTPVATIVNPKSINQHPYGSDFPNFISPSVRARLELENEPKRRRRIGPPILNEGIITSNQQSFVTSGGGPPSVNMKQAELVVV